MPVATAPTSATRRPAIGAASSRTVYSGVPPDDGVGTRVTPGPAVSTTTTTRPPCPGGLSVSSRPASAGTAAGTRIQLASPAYGTPTFVPVTVPEPTPHGTATVAGTAAMPVA